MEFYFDSRSKICKTPFGCVAKGEILFISVFAKDVGNTNVFFLMEKDGEGLKEWPMKWEGAENGFGRYTCNINMEERGLYFYWFKVISNHIEKIYYRNEKNYPVLSGDRKWQLTCYEQSEKTDFYGLVMYQIFPDRFNQEGTCDTKEKLTPFYLHENKNDIPGFCPDENGEVLNNDFFGGNLQGIIKKLPYLASLGVQALYLNPIFMAFSNHRYDTADYLKIDPMLGTEDDFKELCQKAHEQGMKVILDGVFSHTGSDSRYFDIKNRFSAGAYHHENSPYKNWYQFTHYPYVYTSWWGIRTLPCVDENNEDYKKFIITDKNSVVRHWLSCGADGWRLDVADELPESFLSLLYQTVKEEKPGGIVIGEVWEDASNKISYGERRHYLQGGVLDSVMNYVWKNAIIGFVKNEISAEDFNEVVMSLCEHYPPHALHSMMNLLSSHDTARILTVLASIDVPQKKEERAYYTLSCEDYLCAKNRLMAAAFLLFTLPGCACIYYGDEIGMQGFEDPFNRAYMGNREGDREIFLHFKALAKLKSETKALQVGTLEPVFSQDGLFGFYRIYENCRVLCVVNCSKETKRVFIGHGNVLYQSLCSAKDSELILFPNGSAAIMQF